MRCHRNISSHPSRCISQPEERGVWCAILSSLSHVAQEQGSSTSLIWQHVALIMSICGPSPKMGGLGCDALLGLIFRESCKVLPCFIFWMKRVFCLKKVTVTWSCLKIGPSAFLWDRAGCDTMPSTPTVMWSPSIRASTPVSFLFHLPHLIQVLGKVSCSAHFGTATGWRHLKHHLFPMKSETWSCCPSQSSWISLCNLGISTTAESSKKSVNYSSVCCITCFDVLLGKC